MVYDLLSILLILVIILTIVTIGIQARTLIADLKVDFKNYKDNKFIKELEEMTDGKVQKFREIKERIRRKIR